jgi:hypothetical protein
MSELRVDTITDEAGTGAPNFPNGIELGGSPFVPPTANFQEFTSSGTWTKPAGANTFYVEVISGGGSGPAARNSTTVSHAGGDGGLFVFGVFRGSDVGSTVTVTVGAGGASVVRTSNGLTAGNAGGVSSFGSLVVASDLSAGQGSFRTRGSVAGAGSSTIYGGAAGGGAIYDTVATTGSGLAGGTSLVHGNGGAGAGGVGSFTATSGTAPGGGGGACAGSGTITSGAGAAGRVRVWSW